MVARLGFAVATDSRPDILIVDEVLAVGDEAFQAKCFKRIESYQALGMTTLLVTHSSERIRSMCNRVVWLQNGEVKMLGATDEVVNDYVITLQTQPGMSKNRQDKPFLRKRNF